MGKWVEGRTLAGGNAVVGGFGALGSIGAVNAAGSTLGKVVEGGRRRPFGGGGNGRESLSFGASEGGSATGGTGVIGAGAFASTGAAGWSRFRSGDPI